MNNQDNINIEIMPASKNIIYEQRESGVTHSPFKLKYIIYNAIRLGNIKLVESSIEDYLKNGLIIGRLSTNNLRQMQYWAVACISVTIHYAILGGLDETDAFNLSDMYIRYVDSLTSSDNIIPYLKEKALELTMLVQESKYKSVHSRLIKQCLHYINIHLHDKLQIASLAKELGISRDYLSTIFKNELGVTLHSYILHEKLEASKLLLAQHQSYNSISYNLSFCSETHYITCFKKEYGITPRAYQKSLYSI